MFLECKCINGPIKGDIALHKENNYNQNTDGGSNNLSTTSINNCKTTISENNVLRTTEMPDNNNNVINDQLAAPIRTKKFPINTAPLKFGSNETEFSKRKNSSPIILELDTPVGNKAM